jgi:hypothetical protein
VVISSSAAGKARSVALRVCSEENSRAYSAAFVTPSQSPGNENAPLANFRLLFAGWDILYHHLMKDLHGKELSNVESLGQRESSHVKVGDPDHVSAFPRTTTILDI